MRRRSPMHRLHNSRVRQNVPHAWHVDASPKWVVVSKEGGKRGAKRECFGRRPESSRVRAEHVHPGGLVPSFTTGGREALHILQCHSLSRVFRLRLGSPPLISSPCSSPSLLVLPPHRRPSPYSCVQKWLSLRIHDFKAYTTALFQSSFKCSSTRQR